MNSLALKHCFKCDKDLPLSRFSKHPDSSYKGQCKPCRNEHEKHRQAKKKALEKGLPPPPPLPKGNISNRGSGINDTQCPKCAVPLLIQHLPIHYEYTKFLNDIVLSERRGYNAEQKRKGRENTQIQKSVPGEKVLVFKNLNAKVYHTKIHRIRGIPGEEDGDNWIEVDLKLQILKKPCDRCCLK